MVINIIIDFLQGLAVITGPIALFTYVIGFPSFRFLEKQWPDGNTRDIAMALVDGLIMTTLTSFIVMCILFVYYIGSRI